MTCLVTIREPASRAGALAARPAASSASAAELPGVAEARQSRLNSGNPQLVLKDEYKCL